MQTIGIIGGSGLYDLPGLENREERRVETPFGSPSDALITGELHGRRLVFLARHGRGHRILPHEINFRANIHALKQVGVEWVISVSAVGSLKEEIHPGDMVVVDQFIDKTRMRASTFFGNGVAGHVSMADPVCAHLAETLYQAGVKVGARTHRGGTYVCMEGPQFSTRAESEVHRRDGGAVIGMTNVPEAKLAREAELCYATLALSTDYDCWHETHEDVSVEAVVAVMKKNTATALAILSEAVLRVAAERTCACPHAARTAVMTDPKLIDKDTRARLALILGAGS